MVDDRVAKLSDVQKQCLRLAAEGRSSKEIAPSVGLTFQTVDQYLQRARVTLGAQNRREAARMFKELERAIPFKELEFKPPAVEEPQNSGISEEPVEQQGRQPSLLDLPINGGPLKARKRKIDIPSSAVIGLYLTIIVLAMVVLFAAAMKAFSR